MVARASGRTGSEARAIIAVWVSGRDGRASFLVGRRAGGDGWLGSNRGSGVQFEVVSYHVEGYSFLGLSGEGSDQGASLPG